MLWERLNECYGSSEMIEESLFKRDFPKIPNKGFHKLRELSDLLLELQVAKAEGDLLGLTFLDTARGIKPIVQKLPHSLQEKWISRGTDYKQRNNVLFPPFSFFVDFVHQQAKVRNDPGFDFSSVDSTYPKSGKPTLVRDHKHTPIYVHKTNVAPTDSSRRSYYTAETEGTLKKDPNKECPLHNKPHSLQKCRGFREKSLNDRRVFLKENSICYRCCASTYHLARDCKANIICLECNSQEHNTALHPGPAPWTLTLSGPSTEHGGEEKHIVPAEVTPQCTQVCGKGLSNKSCSKICLATVYPIGQKEKAVKLYAILDDQSNKSLASSAFFDIFQIKGSSSTYSLKTCTGVSEETGRRATGYQIESLDGQISLPLPTLIECNSIPDNREEIPTPEAALHHEHLRGIAHLIPALDPQAKLVLLLGRDIIRIHKVRKQINGPHNSPYAQKLDLGWVLVGDVCLGNAHKPENVNILYTNTLENGRPSLFLPCPNKFIVKEKFTNCTRPNITGGSYTMDYLCDEDRDHLGCTVFQRTREDHKIAHSIEDETFLKVMGQGFCKNETNSWVAPLPFKPQRPCLPNNKEQALKRLAALKCNFQKRPEMKEHFFAFMEKIFKNDHAEIAPPLKERGALVSPNIWHLPSQKAWTDTCSV
ncbi:zinc finger [Pristimantis euphronides]